MPAIVISETRIEFIKTDLYYLSKLDTGKTVEKIKEFSKYKVPKKADSQNIEKYD